MQHLHTAQLNLHRGKIGLTQLWHVACQEQWQLTDLLKQACSLRATAGVSALEVCSSLASAFASKRSNFEGWSLPGVLSASCQDLPGNIAKTGAHNLLVRIFSRLSRRTSATTPVLS